MSVRRGVVRTLRRLGFAYPADLVVGLRSAIRGGAALRVPVLSYHRVAELDLDDPDAAMYVAPKVFEAQMRRLSERGYQSVFASELCRSLRDGSPLPPRPVVLTFDDGFSSVREHAVPVLSAYDLRATVFLISGRSGPQAPAYLTRHDVRAMAASERFEFGSHTRSHKPLTSLDASALRDEIVASRSEVAALTGRECEVFCYPFGAFDGDILELVRAAGYRGAFCSSPGIVHSDARRFAIARVPGRNEPIERFDARLRARSAG